jgi:hypothetical protein
VWVPTEFHRAIFIKGGVDSDRVVVIPEPVDTDVFSPAHAAEISAASSESAERVLFHAEQADGSARPFRFLSIFKFEERKGWKILIEAFVREFAGTMSSSPVALYILTSAYHTEADFEERIHGFLRTLNWQGGVVPPLPPIRLLPSGLSADRLVELYSLVDCFVLPSRGEGWGRPHVEAMSMSLPVIATHWSGPGAFMTEENSFPLRHDVMATITEGAFRGHQWAEPSQTHLRDLMRAVMADPNASRQKGQQARQDMLQKFCQQCVADIVIRELARVQKLAERSQNNADSSSISAGEAHEEL